MENKREKVTFDILHSVEKLKKDDTLLVNNKYWQTEKFSKIFFERKSKFSNDQDEIKKEYYIWHSDLVKKYYDVKQRRFTLEIVPFYRKKYINQDLFTFLNFHPLLTIRDQKNIQLFRSQINNRFKRFLFLDSVFGLFSFIMFIKMKSSEKKIPFNKLVKSYSTKFFILYIASCLIIDTMFKLNKPYMLINILKEKNLIDKYFQSYL